MPTLHGVLLSPFVRKARLGLLEKGIAHELHPVMPFPPHNATPEFRRMSPLGKIPAFEDDDLALSDSSVILAYLERAYPSPPLYPQDAADYARALWYEELADSRLIESIAPIFFQRIVAPHIMKQDPDQAVIDNALHELLPPQLTWFEGQLEGKEYLVGSALTVADIATGAMLRQLHLAGETIDPARHPNLASYVERIFGRPTFKAEFADEDAAVKQMMG